MNGALRGPALLFCPADRPDRYAKALAAADTVILDLEDAVAPSNKAAARDALVGNPIEADRVIVRINAAGTEQFKLDLAALKLTAYRRIMLAKTEPAAHLGTLAEYEMVALCETAMGIEHAYSIAAAPNVIALMFGAEDLIADLGGRSSRGVDGRFQDVLSHARSTVLLAARANGKQVIDTVHTEIADLSPLRAESRDAAASGFDHKACIHPSQVAVVRDAFRPTEDEIAVATQIVKAASAGGALAFNGRMIDAPLLVQARTILARSNS